MKSLRIELDSNIHLSLKMLAVERGTTVSELVRDSIMSLVDAPVDPAPPTPKEISPPKDKQESQKNNNSDFKFCKQGHPYRGSKCLVCK